MIVTVTCCLTEGTMTVFDRYGDYGRNDFRGKRDKFDDGYAINVALVGRVHMGENMISS